MNWETAVQLSHNCVHSMPATVKGSRHELPQPNDEAVVLCREKIRRRREPLICTPNDCPEGVSK